MLMLTPDIFLDNQRLRRRVFKRVYGGAEKPIHEPNPETAATVDDASSWVEVIRIQTLVRILSAQSVPLLLNGIERHNVVVLFGGQLRLVQFNLFLG